VPLCCSLLLDSILLREHPDLVAILWCRGLRSRAGAFLGGVVPALSVIDGGAQRALWLCWLNSVLTIRVGQFSISSRAYPKFPPTFFFFDFFWGGEGLRSFFKKKAFFF